MHLLCRRPLLSTRLVPTLRSLSPRLGPLARPFSLSRPRNDAATVDQPTPYLGPLAPTFRRLKVFSLASLSLSFTLAPFMFLIESNLPLSARFALASIAIGSSGISTAMVGWCGKPYVTTLKRIPSDPQGTAETLEMTTLTLLLHPRVTKVYDPYFLIETRRPFAKWELADTISLPPNKDSASLSGQEETIAETFDKDGRVLGRWIVKWEQNGEGKCREVGTVARYFNVHEELL
ncbi:hypothetical protein BDQ17DRAFT_1344140 [Cyathus striatus]|nr:hypothetical protein BDQ17DRAFT_1344140 [Cyathus striatus]